MKISPVCVRMNRSRPLYAYLISFPFRVHDLLSSLTCLIYGTCRFNFRRSVLKFIVYTCVRVCVCVRARVCARAQTKRGSPVYAHLISFPSRVHELLSSMYFVLDAAKSVSCGVHPLSTLIASSKFLKRFASPLPPSSSRIFS